MMDDRVVGKEPTEDIYKACKLKGDHNTYCHSTLLELRVDEYYSK